MLSARDEPFPVEQLVTQPLRLIQPVGGEEDGDAAVTQPWYSPGDSGMIEIRWRISPALAGPTGMPATAAEPAVAEISVPRIRTVVVLPAPLRVLCGLTRGNRQPCHLVGDRRVTTAAWLGRNGREGQPGRGIARVRHRGLPGLH